MIHSLQRLLREPLLHFFVLGGAIFLLFGVTGDAERRQPDEIVVTAGQIDRLVEGWKKTRIRAPTVPELEGLVADHIREEIYYREALAMGLDSDDMIIRRRLRQKMEFLTEDLVRQAEPTEAELQTYLDDNASAFLIEPRFTFRHVYFSEDKRGEHAHNNAITVLASLREADGTIDIATRGDLLPLARSYKSLPTSETRNLFGQNFATQLLTLELGSWQGPVRSGYGLHLVFVDERTEPREPALDEVRNAVIREWREARRREANEKLYRHMRDRYTIVIKRPEWMDEDMDLAAAKE
jgi:hypothetical protein